LFFLFFFIIANRIYFSFEVKTIKGENKNKCWNLIRRRSKERAKKKSKRKKERINKEKFMSLLKEASLTTSRRQGKNLSSVKKIF
jgi:hypothetical protein